MSEFERCDGCSTPSCFTPYPEDDHPAFAGKIRGCFAEKARSSSFTSVPTQRLNLRDKEIARDNDAYRRLRKDGLQPDRVDGSAKLEATLR